jgi:acyl-CoA synthetase (AMP-forming)/AMP-acid ligase II/thioesterase domain-containing protein
MTSETLLTFLDTVGSVIPEPLGIISYAEKSLNSEPRRIPYSSLKQAARERCEQLRSIPGFYEGKPVLLHFTDHLDNILWFWAVLLAGSIPALSTPLPNDLDQRRKHLAHLFKLFENPICLTRINLQNAFSVQNSLNVRTVESLVGKSAISTEAQTPPPDTRPDDIAALMLTSGSTGNAKAVQLTHRQILASVAGKATIVSLDPETTFFNWVGIDHVAGLLECHLEAMYKGMEQVHVQATDLIADPVQFLEIISYHRVGRTFAPNFFLASLLRTAAGREPNSLAHIDISCLRCLVSGGEANPVRTAQEIDGLLKRFGAPEFCLTPGFGMTETCAGSIYNRLCPSFDVHSEVEFASLGHCVPGIEMRIAGAEGPNQKGPLQVRGPIITRGYYNNLEATTDAFTVDGWFDTGDEARIDDSGALHIVGRIKEHIRINGMAIIPTDIESALNSTNIPGAAPEYYVCFAFRPKDAETERLAVGYLPEYASNDIDARVACNAAIVKAVMLQSGVCPYVLPLDETVLQKSTLGKLSRGKVKTRFMQGDLKTFQDANDAALQAHQAKSDNEPRNQVEKRLLHVTRGHLVAEMNLPEFMIGIETPLFALGVSSIHLISLKRKIERALELPEVPILMLLTNQTVRSLADAVHMRFLDSQSTSSPASTSVSAGTNNLPTPVPNATYNPIVPLRTGGTKPPLWLFHPGVGEVLVFLNLAKYLDDRPVYALRARGFEAHETFFPSIADAVRTYAAAITAVQPAGPYALAGYSYGAMLAFETAKALNARAPGAVRFLASLNLPPHIAFRMRQLSWLQCALHLGVFLGVVDEDAARAMVPRLREASREAVVETVLSAAPPGRMEELALTRRAFGHWVDLAFGLQSMAKDYEPSGKVAGMDVFHCVPLAVVAATQTEWMEKHIGKWVDFCEDGEEVRFHSVGGGHYSMIDQEHVGAFQKVFQAAMTARGV